MRASPPTASADPRPLQSPVAGSFAFSGKPGLAYREVSGEFGQRQPACLSHASFNPPELLAEPQSQPCGSVRFCSIGTGKDSGCHACVQGASPLHIP